MSGRGYLHYGMILVPLMVYPFTCIDDLVDCVSQVKHAIVSVVTIVVLSLVVLPMWIVMARTAVLAYPARYDTTISPKTLDLCSVISDNTTQEDEIVVCGNYALIYNLCDRFSPSKYAYQSPICDVNDEFMKEFISDVQSSMPKAIVVCPDFSNKEFISNFVKENGYKEIELEEEYALKLYILN